MIRTSNRATGTLLASSKPTRVVNLGVVTTATIDFKESGAFKCDTTSSSGLTIAIDNEREGCQAALYVDDVNTENHALTFPSGWTWITAKPTQLNSGDKGILAIECFDGTGIVAAWKSKVQ